MKTMRGKEPAEMRHLHQVCQEEHPWAIRVEHPTHKRCPWGPDGGVNPDRADCGYPNLYTCEECEE